MYRYVDKFHLGVVPAAASSRASPIVGPGIPNERRREMVYLANELDSFKQKMAKAT